MFDEETKRRTLEVLGSSFESDPNFQKFSDTSETISIYPPDKCESYDKTEEFFLLSGQITELVDRANGLGVPLMIAGFPRVEKGSGQSITLSIAIKNPRHNSPKFSEALEFFKKRTTGEDSEESGELDFESLLRALDH